MLFVHFLFCAQPSDYYQVLFMGEFFYQSEKILKRHLRVSMKIYEGGFHIAQKDGIDLNFAQKYILAQPSMGLLQGLSHQN